MQAYALNKIDEGRCQHVMATHAIVVQSFASIINNFLAEGNVDIIL